LLSARLTNFMLIKYTLSVNNVMKKAISNRSKGIIKEWKTQLFADDIGLLLPLTT